MLRHVQREGWSAYAPEHLAMVQTIIETLTPPPEVGLLLHSRKHCRCLLPQLDKAKYDMPWIAIEALEDQTLTWTARKQCKITAKPGGIYEYQLDLHLSNG